MVVAAKICLNIHKTPITAPTWHSTVCCRYSCWTNNGDDDDDNDDVHRTRASALFSGLLQNVEGYNDLVAFCVRQMHTSTRACTQKKRWFQFWMRHAIKRHSSFASNFGVAFLCESRSAPHTAYSFSRIWITVKRDFFRRRNAWIISISSSSQFGVHTAVNW